MQLREHGITTSINPQYDASESWSGIKDIAPFLTLFICHEAELINCIAAPNGTVHRNLLSAASAAETLLQWGALLVVVTRGSLGASVFSLDKNTGELSEVFESSVVLDVSSVHSLVFLYSIEQINIFFNK